MNWAQYAENTEKSFVPVADKMVADGTILGYSTFETIVHSPDGYTHGAAWTSTSIAGLLKVLDELQKGGPQPGQIAATKHEDYVMQTSMSRPAEAAGSRRICGWFARMRNPRSRKATRRSSRSICGRWWKSNSKKGRSATSDSTRNM